MEKSGGGYRCPEAKDDRGWINSMMRTLNDTFPHRDHVLVNMGVSGANWRHFAHGSCLEYHLPLSPPDLLILEHVPENEDNGDPSGLSLELLLNRVRLHYLNSTLELPPVICLNAVRTGLCTDSDDAECWSKVQFNCQEELGPCLDELVKSNVCKNASAFRRCIKKGSYGLPGEASANLAAQNYNIASLSMANLVYGLMSGNNNGNDGQLSEHDIISSIIDRSRVHPTELGKRLLTDLVLLYLAQAQIYLSDNTGSADASGAGEESSIKRDHCPRWIPPVQPTSIMVPQSHCFGIPVAMVGSVMTDEVLRTDPAAPVMAPINVTLSKGWKFVTEEGGKARPGWVATVPGSVLETAFDVDYTEAASLSIRVTYLVSYEHMGSVEFTCHGGCHCDGSVISGHYAQFKQSVPRTHDIRIWKPIAASSGQDGGVAGGDDGASSCVARLEVLDVTESGEHKFKVIRLSINYFVNISSVLEKHCV